MQPREDRHRLALGEPDEPADVGEAVRRGGGALDAALSHRAAQVVGDDAPVVDGRGERRLVSRRRLGDLGRSVDDSVNGHLPTTPCDQS